MDALRRAEKAAEEAQAQPRLPRRLGERLDVFRVDGVRGPDTGVAVCLELEGDAGLVCSLSLDPFGEPELMLDVVAQNATNRPGLPTRTLPEASSSGKSLTPG